MNIRTTPNPVIRRAGRMLRTLNDRHPWNHNVHFHPWILRSLPQDCQRVLDVGCGVGDLVLALSTRAREVDGIDPDQGMVDTAARRCQELPGVRIHRRTLEEHAAERRSTAAGGSYDAITMVASLHHMPLETALRDARDLLRPGGRLLVATLTTPETAFDHAWDVGNALTNPLIGVVKHPRVAQPTAPAEHAMPVRDPAWSFGELRERARPLLPGAVLRRRQGFRSTLLWQKPAG